MASKTKFLQALTLSLLMAAMLVVGSGCGAQQAASSASSSSSAAAASDGASAQGSASTPTPEQYTTVLDPTDVVSTFIGEKFYDQKVTDAESALAAVESVYDRIGADKTTALDITSIRPTETGTTYYIFNQLAGDVHVYGASVKLIVDKDGMVAGLVSAILPNVEIAQMEDWEITAAQAEQIVVEQLSTMGHAGMKPVEGATEQTLISIPNLGGRRQYAWVVYTGNIDADSEMSYLAHYVDAQGGYLYAIPISEPHNADAETGDVANFDFAKFEQETWSGTVTLHDGTTKEIEVPVLVDKDNGNASILADGKRKILCADYAGWHFDDMLQPRVSADGSFDNVELIAYDAFIKVWDFYDSVGWTGPDDEGTPTLLLMDFVDENRQAIDNACYAGRQNGFQTFAFNRLNPDGENMDIMAHEFTHCVTSTTMTTNLYVNEMGAINEGMSDILGNLVEMLLVGKPETAWLLGDSSGVGTLRSMKNPHDYLQPEFRWDAYYTPNVSVTTLTNDYGGTHYNSSLLNIVSYKLDQAGMEPADQFYFWMNVALAMTTHTDYEQMAQLLPWCMEQAGYPQFTDALKAAIDEAGYTSLEKPDSMPAGNGQVSIAYNVQGITDAGLARFELRAVDGADYIATWPAVGGGEIAVVVPAGDYSCRAFIGSTNLSDCDLFLYTNDGWQVQTGDTTVQTLIHVEEGQTIELPATGLPS